MQSDLLNELAAALVEAQAEFETVSKTDTNPFFKSKYAGLPEVMKTAQPVLSKHGLAVSQHLSCDEQGDTLTTWLIHKSGQYIKDTMRLHLSKNDAQGQGSATTYARRYSYMAVLGLVADEDDDGNAASSKHAYKPATASQKPANPFISPNKMTELKTALAKAGITGQAAIDFSQKIIAKSNPRNEADVRQLLNALELGLQDEV